MMVKRRTNREKFRNSLRAMKEWIRKVRCGKLSELLVVLRRKLLGYRNYYGVIGVGVSPEWHGIKPLFVGKSDGKPAEVR